MTNILKEYQISPNEPIVVGVSAGPDSMCLLHILQKESKNIICAHINHNIREESKEEEQFLKDYCQNNNIIFECHKIEKYREKNFENEARKIRYNFYEQILNKYKSKYLFLAHHGDDLMETVLMKLIRGSNLEGYAGIKKISTLKNYSIIRPLLDYTKQDLIDYNINNKISYYLDKTNEDITYTRNRYRKNFLPLLKQEDKNIHKKFIYYSNTLLEYDNYIKEESRNILKEITNNNILDLNKFNTYKPLIKKNILYEFLRVVYDNKLNNIKDKNITSILNIINSNKPNLTLNIPEHKIVIKEYDKLYITDNYQKNTDYKIEFNDNLTINDFIFIKEKNITEDGNNICRLNYSDIKLPLYFKNKSIGDTIKVKGLNGTKKIKDIFINEKIPLKLRNSYPILVDSNNNILWIPNLKKSQFNIQKDKKCDIIIKCYIKGGKNE